MKKVNPAVKNMAQLMLYLLLMIGMWMLIASVAFPKKSTVDTVKAFVQKNEAVLIQVAQNAMDESVNPGIQSSVDVLEILGEGKIGSVFAREDGAVFEITGDRVPENGHLYLIYLPDSSYAFDREGEWTASAPDKNGTLRWEDGQGTGSYVAVTRLADHFFLEESSLPD